MENSGEAAPVTPALEQLATEADLLDLTEAGAAGDAPGAAAPTAKPAAPEIPTADFLAGMLAPTFDNMAPNWKVKPHEVKMLAVGWAGVLDKYFPGGVRAWGPWGVALAASAAVIGPRLNIPPRIEEKPDATPTPAPAGA